MSKLIGRTVASVPKQFRPNSVHNLQMWHAKTTPCLKKRFTFTTCYNFYIYSSIATIFGTNVAEKVGNQNVLYFLTSPN